MCHTDIPAGEATPEVRRGELELGLSTGERMPALEYGDAGAPGVLLVADVCGISPFLKSPPPAPLELAGQLRGPVLAFWGEDDEIVPRAGTWTRTIRHLREHLLKEGER